MLGRARDEVLLSTFFVVCIFVHLDYGLLFAACAQMLAGPRFTRILNRTSGLLFWLRAALVLWNGVLKPWSLRPN